MKLPREVTIRIRPDGRVEIETEGFAGKSCEDLSRHLERLVAGGDAPDADVQRERKAEYYLPEAAEAELEDRAG